MNDKTEQVMHPWGFCSEGGGGGEGRRREKEKGETATASFLSPPSPFKSQISSLLTPKEGLILRL